MYYVYFLGLNNDQIYTGSSGYLKERISDHKKGKVKSTKHRLPFVFLGYEAYHLKSDALRRERYLKTTEGKRLFRQQYRDIISQWRGNN